MNLNKQRAFIIHFIFFLILTLLLYVGIKYVFPLLMPFVIGIVIAMSFRNLIDLIEKKTHSKRVFISILTLLAFYSLLGFIISLIGVKMVNFVSSLFYNLPTLYKETLLPALNTVTDNMIEKYPSTRTYLDNFMSNIDQSVFTYLSQISTKVVSMATGFAGMLPTLLIKFIFTIVSSFFFTIDYYKITRFIVRQFKPEHQKVILNLKDNVIGSLGNFIKAYTAIISITFAELSIGFWILGIPSPFLFGLLVAIIDIMPILGTGAVLLPWSVIAFIIGNTKVGMGMLILYIFITVVRQILEPKIVGQQIGLYPIVTLVLMYVGAQLMGVLGLLILPIMATILIKLNKEGSIHLFKI
ncbi:sporulation integral membrane protein YtvI [Anaerocolumna sp. AGMB13020]|uniref:sporulation integral membrane protein YtvI n=1 Tax=Anaerocolumna sp. AGMB13020 TaxID=3081750 RepID=UPI00295397CF|nr:sporulation integral membrane protein YtvI [Anaerocolumna sp. AGMB13020]WOO34864.1 sporulation integral membrane protein YtvI [Anaerocolumna sp. AGMB13020]